MAELKLAYVYVAGGADPNKHRIEVPTPEGISIVAVGAKDYEQAVEVCKELVDNGVQMLELCPGFGNIGVGKVAEAVGDRAVIGVVRVDRLPALDCKSGDTLFNTK